jgi:hypothetical protein
MTEEEWLRSDSLPEMYGAALLRFSDRRLRLIACAVVRQLWQHLHEPGRALVEIAERYADRQATWQELRSAYELAEEAFEELAKPLRRARRLVGPRENPPDPAAYPRTLAAWLADVVAADYLLEYWYTLLTAYDSVGRWHGVQILPATEPLHALARDIVRDIVGCPHQPAPVVDPVWLTWNRGIVRGIAEEIYNGRCFDQLPILADALEEAGCNSALILDHCRRPGLHVRGCWVLDLLLSHELEVPGGGLVLRQQPPPTFFTLRRPIKSEGTHGRPPVIRVSLRVEPWNGPGCVVCHVEDTVRHADATGTRERAILALLWRRFEKGLNRGAEDNELFGQIRLIVTAIQSSNVKASPAGFGMVAGEALDDAVARGDWIRQEAGT